MLFPYSRSGNCASLHEVAEFAIFWLEVMKQSELDADEPTLPRKCKTPSREVGARKSHYPSSIEDHYVVQYFEALHLLIACIKDRFNQPGCFLKLQMELALDEDCFSGDGFCVLILIVPFQNHRCKFFRLTSQIHVNQFYFLQSLNFFTYLSQSVRSCEANICYASHKCY